MEYAYYVLPGIDLYYSKVSIYRYCFDIEGYRKIDSDIVSKRIALSFTILLSMPGFSIRRDDSGQTQVSLVLATSRLVLSWTRQAETSARSY